MRYKKKLIYISKFFFLILLNIVLLGFNVACIIKFMYKYCFFFPLEFLN